MRTKIRELLRLPVRVERPRRRFQPQRVERVLGSLGRRVLSNATPAKGLSAPTSDKPENAECNAPPTWLVVARHVPGIVAGER